MVKFSLLTGVPLFNTLVWSEPLNLQDSCINSATDRRGYVLERMCLPNSVK